MRLLNIKKPTDSATILIAAFLALAGQPAVGQYDIPESNVDIKPVNVDIKPSNVDIKPVNVDNKRVNVNINSTSGVVTDAVQAAYRAYRQAQQRVLQEIASPTKFETFRRLLAERRLAWDRYLEATRRAREAHRRQCEAVRREYRKILMKQVNTESPFVVNEIAHDIAGMEFPGSSYADRKYGEQLARLHKQIERCDNGQPPLPGSPTYARPESPQNRQGQADRRQRPAPTPEDQNAKVLKQIDQVLEALRRTRVQLDARSKQIDAQLANMLQENKAQSFRKSANTARNGADD